MSDPAQEAARKHWRIHVSGYGSFIVVGSEKNARQRARDKAEWEGGIWQLHPATEAEIQAAKTDCQDVDKIYEEANP